LFSAIKPFKTHTSQVPFAILITIATLGWRSLYSDRTFSIVSFRSS